MNTRTALVIALPLLVHAAILAQDPRPRLDLDRILNEPAAFAPRLPRVGWIPGDASYWVVGERDGAELAVRHAAVGTLREDLFGARQLHDALAAVGAPPPVEDAARRLPPFSFVDATTVRVETGDAVYHWNLRAAEPRRLLRFAPGSSVRAIAPGDTRAAFVVDHDIVVRRPDGGLRRITWDGSEDIVYGGAAHRAEFGIRTGLWWDPTGRFLAWSREDQRPNALTPYADYRVVPARPVHGRYPMAGSPHASVTIGVYDSLDDSVRYLEHDPAIDLYWTNVTFRPDGMRVFVVLVNRGQDHADLVEFDTLTGERQRVLLSESDREWVEPEHGPIFWPGTIDGFLWFSPRDGFRHLWAYGEDGQVRCQFTRGSFDVHAVEGFTDDGSTCFVTASGEDPRSMHLFAVTRDGVMRRISEGSGWHDCQVADDGSVLDTRSSTDDPGSITLRVPGAEPRLVHRAADPLAGFAVGRREFFTIAASDGTPLHGQILLPPDFDETRSHPVLHYVYGGPQVQVVQDRWPAGVRELWLCYLASRGFVVSRLDNRGTSNRGIEFAQSVYRRLGVLEVEDQVAAIDWLRRKPWIDADRIGVHGWSYGGYMTLRLMLLAPDRFACGVAGAPVTDWRQYETGYTERYMDTPAENPEGYDGSSCLPLAGNLRGRLLVIHGTDDKTVMLSNPMTFLDACIDSGTLVEFMAYPMQQHGFTGKARTHVFRTMTRWFEEHLSADHGTANGR
jgi:dipeptidyl-peptidase-4